MTDLYLSLGSNLGDRHDLMLRAIDLLARRVGRLVRCSSLIETAPWGFQSDHAFLNAVALFRTDLTPREVLLTTQAIERELGRTEKTAAAPAVPEPAAITSAVSVSSDTVLPPYQDRLIDIDILLYGDERVDAPDLQIPHPRMQERDFVLRPLAELRRLLA